MIKNSFLVIFAVVLAVFVFAFGSVSAQDVDLDSLSNEQLMMLLQSIMQKLEADTNAEPTDQAAETESDASETKTAENTIPGPTEMTKPAAEKKQFQIYENKKLVIGRMPDSWFIRKPVQSEGDSQEDENDSNEGSSDSHEDGRDGGEYILYDYSEVRDAYIGTDAYAVPGTWSGISGGISSYTPEYVPSTSLPAPEVTGGYATVPDYSGAFVK